MPVLVATGLRDHEFDALRKNEGPGVPKEVSENGRVTQFSHQSSSKVEEGVSDYITEDEPTTLNNIKQ